MDEADHDPRGGFEVGKGDIKSEWGSFCVYMCEVQVSQQAYDYCHEAPEESPGGCKPIGSCSRSS